MDKDYTHITLVVDRSGSMGTTKNDAQGGINQLFKDQATKEGKCTLTLVEFDTTYDIVHDFKPINEVTEYTLVPRGSTALLDAVGKAIVTTGEKLAALPEDQRPGLVMVVIVTDGEENSSREYNKQKIRELITQQQDVYKWQFTFLGADQNAFHEAASMGMSLCGVAAYNAAAPSVAYTNISSKITRMRDMVAKCVVVDNKFTDEELEKMK